MTTNRYPIEVYPAEVLTRRADDVTEFGEAAEDLMRRLSQARKITNAFGVAAPQIGVSLRAFVFHEGRDDWGVINPVILEREGSVFAEEGCLSMPGVSVQVERADFVHVAGVGPDGTEMDFKARGHIARVVQHEVDHLDGILTIDRVSRQQRRQALRTWDKVQESGRKQAAKQRAA